MTNKVVDLEQNRRRGDHKAPTNDFWFGQLDVRLGRIERLASRLEMQMLTIACGAFALLVLEIIQAVSGA